MKLKIGSESFRVKIASTEASRRKGLKGVKTMPKDAGLVLKFDKADRVPITMEGMEIPIDIVFIKDNKVQKVKSAKPGDKDVTHSEPSDQILEINLKGGGKLKRGMSVETVGEVKEDGTIEYQEGGSLKGDDVHVLDQQGNVQMKAKGDERIFSRKHTQQLYDLSSKAFKSKEAKDYKSVGRAMVRMLKQHETQAPEFVE